jgi:cbb3-type cytochrome oxidase cytochrome c subunit
LRIHAYTYIHTHKHTHTHTHTHTHIHTHTQRGNPYQQQQQQQQKHQQQQGQQGQQSQQQQQQQQQYREEPNGEVVENDAFTAELEATEERREERGRGPTREPREPTSGRERTPAVIKEEKITRKTKK